MTTQPLRYLTMRIGTFHFKVLKYPVMDMSIISIRFVFSLLPKSFSAHVLAFASNLSFFADNPTREVSCKNNVCVSLHDFVLACL